MSLQIQQSTIALIGGSYTPAVVTEVKVVETKNLRKHYSGRKDYELTNHLGNVLVTVSDRKIGFDTDNDGKYDGYTADIRSSQDYLPGGMLMPGRNYNANQYKFGYQGSMKDDEITNVTGENITTFFREFNTSILHPWSMDPVTNPSESPYCYMHGNPIWFNDPMGNFASDPSTHTDEFGKVVQVNNDKDLGVYKHDNLSGWDGKSILSKSGNDVTKMGETWTIGGFADFKYWNDSKVSQVVGKNARINFASDWATDQVSSILNENPSWALYASNARSYHPWDIKRKSPDGPKNVYFGSMLFGKYASARDAGNFTAGAVAQKSIVPNAVLDYGFGVYNQSGNNIGKSALMVLKDFSGLASTNIGAASLSIQNMLKIVKSGEDKLSKAGIDAGKSFIKSQGQ